MLETHQSRLLSRSMVSLPEGDRHEVTDCGKPPCHQLNPFSETPANHRLTGSCRYLVPDSHTFFDARFLRRELKRFVRIALD
jgi:hypothetical protein